MNSSDEDDSASSMNSDEVLLVSNLRELEDTLRAEDARTALQRCQELLDKRLEDGDICRAFADAASVWQGALLLASDGQQDEDLEDAADELLQNILHELLTDLVFDHLEERVHACFEQEHPEIGTISDMLEEEAMQLVDSDSDRLQDELDWIAGSFSDLTRLRARLRNSWNSS